jgi:uncharacterized protein (TIGR02646 family)
MRQLRRPNVTLPTLGPEGAGGRISARQNATYISHSRRPTDFQKHWTAPDVRGALVAMQGKVCAYCGADLTEGGNDVEHFRPAKIARDPLGGYWWIAYDFGNYFLSCKPCNQERKGDRFPVAGNRRVRYESRDAIAREERILLDPAVDPVEEWLEVNWELDLAPVVPRSGLEELTERVEKTIKFFRLNLDLGHIKGRMAVRDRVVLDLDEGRTEEVRRSAIRYCPHSLVAKTLLAAKSPQDLPTVEDEVRWLVDELSRGFKVLVRALENSKLTDDSKVRQADELLWALAVLWKDPPNGAPENVAKMLEDRGMRDAVAEYLGKL